MEDEDFEKAGFVKPDLEEIKRVAISLLTLSVHARTVEDREFAMAQFTEDFAIVTQDLKNLEWVALVSMLANCGGALVGVAANSQDIDSTEMMEMMAEMLLGE